MALNFYTQGVDFSGLGQGIARGLEQAYAIKRQEDLRVQKSLDDFEKNYNTEKLRVQDLPAFTTAFKDYKEYALKYSRLNRGGAKPEEIAIANEIKDRALNELKDIYSKSSMANQFLQERNEYRKIMANKDRDIPEEVNTQIMQLSTMPAKDIDFKSLTSPYEIDLKPSQKDVLSVSKLFKDLPKSVDEDVEETQDFDVPGYGKAKVRVMGEYKKANYDDAINVANIALLNSRINNENKDDYEMLIQGLNLPDDVADPRLAILKKNANNTIQSIEANTGRKFKSIEEITPSLLLAYKMGGLSRQRVGYRTDKDELNAAFKTAGIKMTQQRLNEMIKTNKNIQENRIFGQTMQKEKSEYKKEQNKNKGSKFGALLKDKRAGKK
jgi:hypothetical protein